MDLDQIFEKLPPKAGRPKIKTSWQVLETEEIFLDAQKDQSHKVETPVKKKNFIIFFSLVLIFFSVLLAKAGWLEIAKGAFYKAQADRNSIRTVPIFAPRGIIYDSRGKQLVYNVPSFDLIATPADLPKAADQRGKIFKRLSEILGKPIQEIEDVIKNANSFPFDPVILAENIDRDKVLILESEMQNLSGISLENNLRREYALSQYFSHILGYVGRMDEQDTKNHPDYFTTETIGKNGLEFQYQDILRTSPGKKEMEVDALGRVQKTVTSSESTNAKGLVLSIDADLQQHLFDSLQNYLQKLHVSKASAVAIDPRNGQVLALVSLPSFDNNLFSKGISAEDYKKIFGNPDQPLFNRAISGQYPPGSTIKPFLGAAGLEEKVVSPKTVINDTGPLTLPNQYNPSIIYNFPDWKTHGQVNIYSAIAESCDIYFYYLGGGYGDFKGLGLSRLEKYLKLFGFGHETGIDLPNEESGFVPDANWKKATKGEDWFTGDTYHLSIGQGDLIVTPLQLAVLTAAIANGGTIWQPKVVDKIIDSEKNIISAVKPEGRKIDFISPANLEIIRQAMRQTVTAGTAQSLKTLPVEAAGKTGTAQIGTSNTTNSLFTSFAPFQNPEIALAIMVEGGGEGNSTAAPVAKDVLGWYFNR